MALREYKCEQCGVFEVIEKTDQEALTICPTCGGAIEKLLSVPGCIIFHGTGFYETDYKNKPKKEES